MSDKIKGNHVSLYIPDYFKETWLKYLEYMKRDGKSAAEEIRSWIHHQVKLRDPSNPQRPLTGYIEGHEDHIAVKVNNVLRALIKKGRENNGFVKYSDMVEMLFGAGVPRHEIWHKMKDLMPTLRKEGVGVIF